MGSPRAIVTQTPKSATVTRRLHALVEKCRWKLSLLGFTSNIRPWMFANFGDHRNKV